MNPYYESYRCLSTKTLRQMLCYETLLKTETNQDRFLAIRQLLQEPRQQKFRVGKSFIIKQL